MNADDDAPTPEEVDAFMRATVQGDEMTGYQLEMLEDRIMALEEIVCARWPRRVFLARRLRRAIRASIKGWPGRNFADRRVSAVTSELMTHEDKRRKKHNH